MKTPTNLSAQGTADLFKNIFCLTLLFSFLFSACDDQRMRTVKWIEYEPVYMTQAEFESAVGMEESRDLKEPGKIYFYDDYLFVNEINEGIHIIDNSDPANPSKVGFINIPANKDMAVRGNLLYADSNSDLVVFNIEDLQNPELMAREEGVFEKSVEYHPGFPYQPVDPTQGIVVDWKKVEKEEVCEGNCGGHRGGFMFATTDNALQAGAVAEQATGVGGSMARFAITGDHLYAVDMQNLLTFDISNSDPVQQGKKNVGWNIETIFPHENNLFIGSESAMYIYDISTPSSPIQLSVYSHLTACDPVVVEENYAYVTLRQGNRCAQGVNRLEVIDVSNLTDPKQVAFYEMKNPHGLGIDNGNLFVSEGDHGLKIMDASDPLNIKPLRHIQDIKTKDVIPFSNVLMVTGPNGILQYDYSDIDNVELLSTIPVESE
jgi:hypothetical protein